MKDVEILEKIESGEIPYIVVNETNTYLTEEELAIFKAKERDYYQFMMDEYQSEIKKITENYE